MSSSLDLAGLILIIVVGFGGPIIVERWTRSAADWFWLLAIRGPLVGAVSMLVLVAVIAFLHLLFGLHFMSALAVLLGLFVTPMVAIPVANRIALLTAPADERPPGGSRDFIFEQRRRQQRDAYAAPRVDR